MEGCKENLIIVTRDKTFLDNFSILKKEFDIPGTRELLMITPHLSEGLAKVGAPSDTIVRAEQKLLEVCSRCGAEMEETGYEGSDGDEFWWMYCPKCGHEEFPEKA